MDIMSQQTLKIYEDTNELVDDMNSYYAKYQINGVFLLHSIDDHVIRLVLGQQREKACLFVMPSEDINTVNIVITGVFPEKKLATSLLGVARDDSGSKLVIPRYDLNIDYIVINPREFLDMMAREYTILKYVSVLIDYSILCNNELIRWNNQKLFYDDQNVELKNINITIPISKNERTPSTVSALLDVISEKKIVDIKGRYSGTPVGKAGFSIGKNTIYFRGKEIKLSRQQFKVIQALIKGYKIDKEKYWSMADLARMGAPKRSGNDYHVNDSFMGKLRDALSGVSGIDGKKILERKNNKYRLGADC